MNSKIVVKQRTVSLQRAKRIFPKAKLSVFTDVFASEGKSINVKKLMSLMDSIGEKTKKQGLTEKKLKQLLRN